MPYEDEVSGDDEVGALDDEIAGLVEVGALTEVGARQLRRKMKNKSRPRPAAPQQQAAPQGGGSGAVLPSPRYARTSPETERRAPLGFTEEATGKNFFTLGATIGATTTMRAKVSRAASIDRMLIVPSDPGAVLDSIRVGDEEQMLASGVPVELYGSEALTDSVPDNFSPIGPGLDLIITLRNTTAAAITGTIGVKANCRR